MNEKRVSLLPQILAIIMLLWALNPENPYGYYVLLRIIVCAICSFLALRAHDIRKNDWVWVLGLTAVIYNPIIPTHLTRQIWSVVNVVTIIILAGTFITLNKKVMPNQEGDQRNEC